MRISDWSSDVCSSDLCGTPSPGLSARSMAAYSSPAYQASRRGRGPGLALAIAANVLLALLFLTMSSYSPLQRMAPTRSEEHTSELQSLMRISYAVFCLKKKTPSTRNQQQPQTTKLTNTTQTHKVIKSEAAT